MKKKYFTNRKFTPEEYKVYVKNNNKIFEYTGEDNIVSVTEKEYKLPFQRTYGYYKDIKYRKVI